MKKIKLNKLSNNEMNKIYGGTIPPACTCSCYCKACSCGPVGSDTISEQTRSSYMSFAVTVPIADSKSTAK